MHSGMHFGLEALPLMVTIPAQVYDQRLSLSITNVQRKVAFERLLAISKTFQQQHSGRRIGRSFRNTKRPAVLPKRSSTSTLFITKRLVQALTSRLPSDSSTRAVHHARRFQQHLLKNRTLSQQQSLNPFRFIFLDTLVADPLADQVLCGFTWESERAFTPLYSDLPSADERLCIMPAALETQPDASPDENSNNDVGEIINDHEVSSDNTPRAEVSELLLSGQDTHLQDITSWKQKVTSELGVELLERTLEDIEEFQLPIAEDSIEAYWHLTF